MRTLLLPATTVWLRVLDAVAGATPAASSLLIGVLVLGLGSGCSSLGAGDPNPRLVRVVAGAEAARSYVRAAAAALPVSQGVPCPTGGGSFEGTPEAAAPRPAPAGVAATERTLALRSTVEERR